MTIPKELILNLLDSSNKNKQKSMLSQLTHNKDKGIIKNVISLFCLLYTSPSPRD